MPSIIEVDTIKNKTGTQNTVLSTDGAGNNTLNANTIKDGSATKTLAEYASSAWSWGAGVPAGSVIQTKFYTFTGGSADIASTTTTAIQDYTSFSCGSGNTILVSFNFRYHAELQSSSNSGRNGFVNVYQSTSSVSSGATSSLGTKLAEYRIGRNLTSNSGSSAASLDAVHVQAVFVSTATTHYIGLAQKSDDPVVQCRIYRTSDSPLLLSIIEIKGDVLT